MDDPERFAAAVASGELVEVRMQKEDGGELVLFGTRHLCRPEDASELQRRIVAVQPDAVGVELDVGRAKLLCPDYEHPTQEKSSFIPLSPVQIAFAISGSLFLMPLVQAAGGELADDLKGALEAARSINIPVVFVDRRQEVTLARSHVRWSNVWASLGVEGRVWEFLWALTVMDRPKIGRLFREGAAARRASMRTFIPQKLLQDGARWDEMSARVFGGDPPLTEEALDTMAEVGTSAVSVEYVAMEAGWHDPTGILEDPGVTTERDYVLADSLWRLPGERAVGVVGLAHIPGIQRHWGKTSVAEAEDLRDVPRYYTLRTFAPVVVGGLAGMTALWKGRRRFPLLTGSVAVGLTLAAGFAGWNVYRAVQLTMAASQDVRRVRQQREAGQ